MTINPKINAIISVTINPKINASICVTAAAMTY